MPKADKSAKVVNKEAASGKPVLRAIKGGKPHLRKHHRPNRP
jgi:hypothetical protein